MVAAACGPQSHEESACITDYTHTAADHIGANLTIQYRMPQSNSYQVLSCSLLSSHEADSWEAFVTRQSEARFSQTLGFRDALERAYRYRSVYLKITRGEELMGIFPSIAIARGGGRMISQPFSEYGGPLGDLSGLGQQAAAALLSAARQFGCESIEIRGGTACQYLAESPHCQMTKLHSYATLALTSKERLWRETLTNEARKGVKKASGSGLSAAIHHAGEAVSDPFYRLYLRSSKRLGVPPHSKRFFLELAAGLKNDLIACWVFKEKEPVAVLLGATIGRRMQIYITASAPEYWNLRPNDLAHWELISHACASGYLIFDFGSARYAGQIQFKKKWGAQLSDYYVYLISSEKRSTDQLQLVNTSGNVMQTAAKIWSAAMPLAVSGYLGPHIRKYLTK